MLESKRRAIIFFIIAIVLAAVSGYLVLKKVQTLNADLGTMENVYVANKDVSSRAVITPDDITTEEMPKKFVRDEYITDPEKFKNKVSVVPLSKGNIITESILKEASSVTEANNRLISILKSDRVFFDEPLTALDRVDIVVSNEAEGKMETEVFMKDVKVARIATNDDEFSGVQLEVAFEDASELIHMHHYADRFRVVKANVGQDQRPQNIPATEENDSEPENDTPAEEETKEDNTEASKDKEQEEKPKEDEKKDEKEEAEKEDKAS